jgi:hypothetical protein
MAEPGDVLRLSWAQRAAVVGAVVLALGLAVYGAVGSYETVSSLAEQVGVPLPALVPLGIDGGLIGVVVWQITGYQDALAMEARVRRAQTRLRVHFGRGWKREALADLVWMLGTAPAEHARPASAETVRRQLGVGAAEARRLTQAVRAMNRTAIDRDPVLPSDVD